MNEVAKFPSKHVIGNRENLPQIENWSTSRVPHPPPPVVRYQPLVCWSSPQTANHNSPGSDVHHGPRHLLIRGLHTHDRPLQPLANFRHFVAFFLHLTREIA